MSIPTSYEYFVSLKHVTQAHTCRILTPKVSQKSKSAFQSEFSGTRCFRLVAIFKWQVQEYIIKNAI